MINKAYRGNKKGFTLVELIVVIAIIGILAAILVPSMMDYVKKSRLQTANANAKTAYTAAVAYIAEQETMGNNVTSLFGSTGKFNAGYIKVRASALNDGDQQVANALLQNGNEAGYFNISYTTLLNGNKSVVAHWQKTTSDDIMGQYPDPIKWSKWKSGHNGWSITTYVSPG